MATDPDAAIEISGLRVAYGDKVALDGIDLSVAPGTILGLLGPNGAGKTTLVSVLSTLQAPTAGRATVLGHDVAHDGARVREVISLTGQDASVDETLSGRANLVLFGRLRGMRHDAAKQRARDLLAAFGLEDAADRRVSSYSGGMRRRLDLATSLVVVPQVLFLDEPTTGLDPASRQALWAMVHQLRDDGVTILLTTQYLEEADRLSDRVVMLVGGRIVADGSVDELKADLGLVVCSAVLADPADAERALGAVADLGAVLDDAGAITLAAPDGAATLSDVIARFERVGIEVSEIGLLRPTLDDVFLRLAGLDQRSVPVTVAQP